MPEEKTQHLGVVTLDRALSLLTKLAAPGPPQDLSVAAAELGIPGSTSRRIAAALRRHGLVQRVAPGRFIAGTHMAVLGKARLPHIVLAEVARPVARRLSERLGAHVHIGVFENDMVTYVVCERCPSAGDLFTREGMQLEAYCTAIGKMVLAWLPEPALKRYLATGSFVPLTAATITEPSMLEAQLADVRSSGVAVEINEIAPDLACAAILINPAAEAAHAAISVAWRPSLGAPEDMMRQLRRAATHIQNGILRQRRRASCR